MMNFKHIDTPFYFYDMELLQDTINELQLHAGNFQIHYALKANSNSKILRLIADSGIGADCVSGNEIQLALDCGFNPDNIVFAGVGKTDKELTLAINSNIACIHCESLEELTIINEISKSANKTTNIAIRLNPNIDAQTHRHISTGLAENKFGIPSSDFPELLQMLETCENVSFIGLHFHVGSQIRDMQVFKNLSLAANDYLELFESLGYQLSYLNIGGGLGIDYEHPYAEPIPNFRDYFETLRANLSVHQHINIHIEPGRSLVGQCGQLISKVLYTKNNGERSFAIIDAGMTELLRPALYDAQHYIETFNSGPKEKLYDIVGPICESSDTFGKHILLPLIKRGDLIKINSAGAYGEVMTSMYNLRQKAQAIYSDQCINTPYEFLLADTMKKHFV